jgi:MoaA/NifB/PqqE/SkfB family radical SAM enzyme
MTIFGTAAPARRPRTIASILLSASRLLYRTAHATGDRIYRVARSTGGPILRRFAHPFGRSRLVRLLRSGSAPQLFDEVVNFWRSYRVRYAPHPMGDFRIDRIDDISRYLAALEDLLRGAFGSGEKGRAKALPILEALISAKPSERTPLVLLAYWRLQQGQPELAYPLARKAASIDSRCLNAQWIVGQCLRARPDLPDVDQVDRDVFSRDFSDCFCPAPFTELITNPSGDVHTCCPLLLPVAIGNVYKDDWYSAWNSAASAEVRRSVHDGDFKYCSRSQCSYMRNNTLPKKAEITDPALRDIIDHRRVTIDTPPQVANLGHDATCNLSCPQCRTNLIVAKGPLVAQLKQANERFVKPMLRDLPHVIVTNSGDPFASRHYREFMKEISETNTPGLKSISLLTNGILFTAKEWDNFSNLHHLNIIVVVSIDAARADTYHEIRRRGDFQRLSANLKFISELRRSKKIGELHLRFAVQADNFEQMPDFVRWGQELDVDLVVFTQLANCGTYFPHEFALRSICDVNHPRHADLINVLGDPTFAWPRVFFDNLDGLRRQALETSWIH